MRVRMNNLTRYSLRILRCFSWAARTSRRMGAVFERDLGLASGIGVLEACQGGTRGQRLVEVRVHIGEDLEEKVVSRNWSASLWSG